MNNVTGGDDATQSNAAKELKREHGWDVERSVLLRERDDQRQLLSAAGGGSARADAPAPAAVGTEQPELLRRALRAEEENELLRALLLLKNVDAELELSSGPALGAGAPTETVRLRGDPRSLRRLLVLVEQTKHLRMSYLLARAEAECFRQTIVETMEWCSAAVEGAAAGARPAAAAGARR